jgi:hypothetical protein
VPLYPSVSWIPWTALRACSYFFFPEKFLHNFHEIPVFQTDPSCPNLHLLIPDRIEMTGSLEYFLAIDQWKVFTKIKLN